MSAITIKTPLPVTFGHEPGLQCDACSKQAKAQIVVDAAKARRHAAVGWMTIQQPVPAEDGSVDFLRNQLDFCPSCAQRITAVIDSQRKSMMADLVQAQAETTGVSS